MPDALEILFTNETKIAVDQTQIEAHLQQILARLQQASNLKPSLQQSGGAGRLVVEIVFVGDKKIRALNAQFRHFDQPTDVLSFERPDGNPEHPASLVISLDTAIKQADQARISLIEEVKTLAGHGLLHVLGLEHA